MADFLGIFGFSSFIGHYYIPSGCYCLYVKVKEMETRVREPRVEVLTCLAGILILYPGALSHLDLIQVVVLLYSILVYRPST